MRTDNPQTPAPVLARLRAPVARARRWVADRGAWTRRGLALVALIALVAAGYLASPTEPDVDWIYAGHSFAPDEVEKILTDLAANNIKAEVDGRGRVAVPADRVSKAITLLDKHHLGPLSLDEIEEAGSSPFLMSPSDRERRDLRKRERYLKYLIRTQPGVVSAEVFLSPFETREGLRPKRTLKATVSVHSEGRGLLPTRTIKMIQQLICSMEPEIAPEGVTLFDDSGHALLVAGDPAAGAQSIARAREQELIGEIATELAWIEGVRVSIHLVTPKAAGLSAPSVGVNQPIDLGPEPEPADSGKAEGPPRPSREFGKAEVVVLVPTSYYRRIIRGNMPDREPTQADLEKLVDQTERAIRANVANVIAPEERGTITIDKYPDVGPRPAAPTTLATKPRPIRSWWVAAVAVAGAGVALVALTIAGGRRLTSRRPAPRVAPSARRESFAKEDSNGAGPGPSDRVRELVRLDPESAAGVLQRWIGQGGHTE